MEYDAGEAGLIAGQSTPSPLLWKLLQKRTRRAREGQNPTPLSLDWPWLIFLSEFKLPLKANKKGFFQDQRGKTSPVTWTFRHVSEFEGCVWNRWEEERNEVRGKKTKEQDTDNSSVHLFICLVFDFYPDQTPLIKKIFWFYLCSTDSSLLLCCVVNKSHQMEGNSSQWQPGGLVGGSLLMAERLELDFRVPSNPDHSMMILWF